ncbi:hypothetical protein QJS10_CPB17g00058 [Acorus calamus]|uniref:CASP-like protein n=1 Tax=Acorus calamus TaxID=4465 RepID=A0AAV9CTE9_ACOCL|nr:hypothetical protein QJS10_CPB17g00058 [Acorus calamus]
MESRAGVVESLLRILSAVAAVATACVVGFDRQTKTIFFGYAKTATVKDLKALWILMIVASVSAGYHLLQLSRYMISAWLGKTSKGCCNKYAAWACYVLDQGVMYVMFASTCAGTQASLLAVTGESDLQWQKLCNMYTRFCIQIGGGLFCGLVASLMMSLVSLISANRLFKLYLCKR